MKRQLLINIFNKSLCLGLAVFMLALIGVRSVAAFTSGALDGLINSTYFYDPTATFGCGDLQANSGPNTAPPSAIQANNAQVIIGVAKTDGLGKQGALIGLMVGLAESGLKNYANSKIPVSLTFPHDAVGSDGYSVGVFQQQPQYTWSTLGTGDGAINNPAVIQQLMTPSYAAEAFFGSPPGSHAPSALSKGLQNVGSWERLDPAVAAATVQGNRDGASTYSRQQSAAQSLLDQYYDSSPAIPLPVAVAAGSPNTQSNNSAASQGCQITGGNPAPGPIDGCVNPFTDAGWGLARTDQGVDFLPAKPLPIRAICDGVILATNGSGWPGGYFILIQLTSGPFAGKCTYVAEHLSDLPVVGSSVKAGQIIATGLPGYPWTEWGWAQGQQTPSTPYNGAPDGTAMPGSKAFARFLRHLGAQTRDDPGPGPEYEGVSCYTDRISPGGKK